MRSYICWLVLIVLFSISDCNGENLSGEPWPNKRIPYVVRRVRSMYFNAITDNTMAPLRAAMRIWEEKTCIRFEEHPSNTSVPHMLVDTITPGCEADVGFQNIAGGQTFVYTYSVCHDALWMLHQLGHAIGLRYEETRTGRYVYPISVAQRPLAALFNDHVIDESFKLKYPRDGYDSTENRGRHGTLAPPKDYTLPHQINDGQTMSRTEKTPNFYDIKSVNLHYNCTDECIIPTGLPIDETVTGSVFECGNEGYLLEKDGICSCQCPFPFKVNQTSHKCEDLEGASTSMALSPGDRWTLRINFTGDRYNHTDPLIMAVLVKVQQDNFLKIEFEEGCQFGSGFAAETREDCESGIQIDVRLGKTSDEGIILCGHVSNLVLSTQNAGDDVLFVVTDSSPEQPTKGGCDIMVESIADDCKSSPCFNGGTCTSLETGGFTCECPLEITGEHCEQIGATTISCDFESVCKGFTMFTNRGFSMTLTHSTNEFNVVEPVLPPNSTFGINNKLFVYGPASDMEDGNVEFHSLGTFSDIGRSRCLSLDWFIGRPEVVGRWNRNSRIEIIKISGNGTRETIYRRMGRAMWVSDWRHIGKDLANDPNGFRLIIRLINPRLHAIDSYNNHGIVAMDNYEVLHQPCEKRCTQAQAYCSNGGTCYLDENNSTRCICPEDFAGPTCKHVVLNRTCTFEEGTCHSFFPEQGNLYINFTRVDALGRSMKFSLHSRVIGAGGSRNYMSLEPEFGMRGRTYMQRVQISKPNRTRELSYRMFRGKFKTASVGIKGNICVEFDYYLCQMNPRLVWVNGIRVVYQGYYIRPEEPILYLRMRRQQPGWNHVKVNTTTLHVKDRISFKGWRVNVPGSVVAFDNINISGGHC